MHYLFIVLILCSVIFLYSLHLLTEDDFVILRKNVSVERVFNAAFLTLLFALLFSRIFYVLLYPKRVFFEPLGFLIFPYFPGLSLIGGILGGIIFFWIYSNRTKMPTARVFDFFAGSFLATLPFGVVGLIILSLRPSLSYAFSLIASLILFTIAVLYFRKGQKYFKDGTFGLFSLAVVGVVLLVSHALNSFTGIEFLWHKENPIILTTILISIVLLFRNEWGNMLKFNGRS